MRYDTNADPDVTCEQSLETQKIVSLRSLPHFGKLTITDRSSVDGDHGPKLWCGMANGKLQVFDASTWMLEQPCLQAKDRIVRSAYVSFNILFNAKRWKKSNIGETIVVTIFLAKLFLNDFAYAMKMALNKIWSLIVLINVIEFHSFCYERH